MGTMERLITLRIALVIASMAAVCAPLAARPQAGEDPSASRLKIKQVPDAVPPEPFSPDSRTAATTAPIEYRSAERMTERDRNLEAEGESSIGEHAGRMGLDFNQGQWSYRQVVCPAFPNHLFLRFMRNNGTGDVSLFTASIPRDGEGRVRIVPIRMRGYSLFSPAPINALTISAFNHIRAEEHAGDASSAWLGMGLCYAALAGGHPETAALTPDSEGRKFPAAIPAELEIPSHSGEIISFTDVETAPKLMQWTMTFNRKGRLLKAAHSPVGMLSVKAVPPTTGAVKGSLVPPTIVNLPGSADR
jgi:hypothetical protein